MASINKVILVGNLGRDPELRTFPSGGAVATVSIATTGRWKDRQTGEQREQTEWHNVVFSNRLAEVAAEYLHKGSSIYIEGRLRTRKWQDQQGNDRYTTEIRADVMQMLGGRGEGGGGQRPRQEDRGDGRNSYADARNGRATPDRPPAQFDYQDDDIPF